MRRTTSKSTSIQAIYYIAFTWELLHQTKRFMRAKNRRTM